MSNVGRWNASDSSEKFRNSYFLENLAAIKLLAKSEQKFPIKAAVFRSTTASHILYQTRLRRGGGGGVMEEKIGIEIFSSMDILRMKMMNTMGRFNGV